VIVRIRNVLVAVSLLLAAPTTAFAQKPKPETHKPDKAEPPLPTEAQRLKKDADALMDQDKYADALALYARAHELSGDVALLYNMGRALEAMGEYPDALDKLEQFEHDASPALRAKVPGLKELLADLRSRIVTLVVTTNAPSARLFVRGKAAGAIEAGKETRIRTRAGAAELEVDAEGYDPYKTKLDLQGGATINVDAQLLPRARDAIIVVRTKPPAIIALNGTDVGRSPLEHHVPPGAYMLSATADGHEPERFPLTITMGERQQIDLELKKSTPLTGKWWFWASIGAVVAGGITTVVLLTTERSPDDGTFSPGRVPSVR
jgi:hypothetical protein